MRWVEEFGREVGSLRGENRFSPAVETFIPLKGFNPWIFREARYYLETGELLSQPSLKERAELCLQHLQLSLEHKGERQSLIGMRRHYAGYFRGMPGAAKLRAELAAYKEVVQVWERLCGLKTSPPGRLATIAA